MIIEQDNARNFARVHFDHQVNVDFMYGSYDHYQTKNLSLTGMFVIGDFQHHVGEDCLVNLVQTGKSTDISLQALAKVVRKDDEGIAVEFTSMPFGN